MNVKASGQRPLREGHQTALAKNVVSPVDAREKGLCPLAVHPFCYRAIGSIAKPALPFRFWVGIVFDTLTAEAKNEVNGIAGQTKDEWTGFR